MGQVTNKKRSAEATKLLDNLHEGFGLAFDAQEGEVLMMAYSPQVGQPCMHMVCVCVMIIVASLCPCRRHSPATDISWC